MTEFDFVAGERGLTLRVCQWGPLGGRPTVILHGWLEQAAAWHDVATQLSGEILAPDHRGHGLSAHVGPGGFYHFWDYVSDLDALLARYAEVDLVGHSMGGTIASLFSALRPEKVRRLVLIEGLGPPDAEMKLLEQATLYLEHRRQPPRHRPLADIEDGIRRMRRMNPGISPEAARRLVERTTRPVIPGDPLAEPGTTGTLVWTWDPLHRARSAQPFVFRVFEQHLRAIRAPTLLVYGAQSTYHLPDLTEREACLADSRRIVLDGAGHLLHHDQPDALAAVLREHFA
jgi:pimeloyl-ACP methyl ester carboxylesterase